jgi:ribonucleoside-diphosphate reductase alpha chain
MSKQSYNGIVLDNNRDDLFTEFGKQTLKDRYLYNGETFQEMFGRIALAGADDLAHAQRMYDYFSNHWCIPATPVVSNLGTTKGLPISCFLNEVEDSISDIYNLYKENAFLAMEGGGIGSYWGNLRGIGAKVRNGGGTTSGIIPFLKVMDSSTMAVSQGNQRRGSAAVYLDVHHPEIEEFIEIRRPTGGDANRKALNLHQGVVMTDEFMNAVLDKESFNLICPKTKNVIKTIDARSLFQRILIARIETGEPYLLFIDEVNRRIPEFHKLAELMVKTSNLCTEITLATSKERTAVCCLFQINQLYFDVWKHIPLFIEDCVRYTDNVLQIFIDTAPEGMAKAKFSAAQERSIGIGVMGFHSYLQSKMIPYGSAMAKSVNLKIGKHLKEGCDAATANLAREKGPCPDAAKFGFMVRNANVSSIAPTASTSIILGESSPALEPFSANAFTQKTLSGSFLVKNKGLEELLESKGMNTPEVWSSIITSEGSVLGLEFLSDYEKEVFMTAMEIDQLWVIEHAAVRQQFVDQAISTNVYLPADVSKAKLLDLHIYAWKKGLKSLYYCRSKSIRRADKVSHKIKREIIEEQQPTFSSFDAGDCLGCQ